eukprot:496033-Amphidinium_carterae.2
MSKIPVCPVLPPIGECNLVGLSQSCNMQTARNGDVSNPDDVACFLGPGTRPTKQSTCATCNCEHETHRQQTATQSSACRLVDYSIHSAKAAKYHDKGMHIHHVSQSVVSHDTKARRNAPNPIHMGQNSHSLVPGAPNKLLRVQPVPTHVMPNLYVPPMLTLVFPLPWHTFGSIVLPQFLPPEQT